MTTKSFSDLRAPVISEIARLVAEIDSVLDSWDDARAGECFLETATFCHWFSAGSFREQFEATVSPDGIAEALRKKDLPEVLRQFRIVVVQIEELTRTERPS